MRLSASIVRWVRSLDRTLADLLLAAAVTATSTVQVLWSFRGEGGREPSLLPLFVIVLQNAPLTWRRRAPIAVLVVVSFASTLAALLDLPNALGIAALIALYTVAANCDRRRSIWAFALTVGWFTALLLVGWRYAGRDLGFDDITQNLLFFSTAWILGDNLRTRRAYMRELENRAVRLERAREADARAAAAAERGRIARELHDVVAHHVSVIAVQAGAARRVADARPESARGALEAIESTARQAGVELRRLLGVLRKGEEGRLPREPQPRLDELEQLVQQARAAGLAVDLAVEGERRALPAGVHLSAYRIVQEALTNTLKHARASTASVRIRYGPNDLELEVADNGRGVVDQGELATGGHGLVGMRERVDLFGGELKVGHRHGGGFKVSARLPLDGAMVERARPGQAAATAPGASPALGEPVGGDEDPDRDAEGPSAGEEVAELDAAAFAEVASHPDEGGEAEQRQPADR
jgi:signal transduction histidine kinase